MNIAIIVAAGAGHRLGSKRPKQFLELAGKPVIQYSLERFDECPSIDSIIVVVPDREIDAFRRMASTFNLGKLGEVVAGGRTRAESVWNGLKAVRNAEYVAVHDGARPLVTVDEIERTLAAAREFGAACLTAAVSDTIKTVAKDEIKGTVDRSDLRRALTPQVFRTELLRRAFANVDLDESITDECYLVERLGHKIQSVPGSSRNIKITVADDYVIAEALLKQ